MQGEYLHYGCNPVNNVTIHDTDKMGALLELGTIN